MKLRYVKMMGKKSLCILRKNNHYAIKCPKNSSAYSDKLNIEFDHYRVGANLIGAKGFNWDLCSIL